MSVYLLLLFVFQSGLALAFSLFIIRMILKGTPPDDYAKTCKGLRWMRNGMAVFSLLLPVLIFGAFFASLPSGQSPVGAVWPAIWIGMIMAAVTTAMAIAHRQFSRNGAKT